MNHENTGVHRFFTYPIIVLLCVSFCLLFSCAEEEEYDPLKDDPVFLTATTEGEALKAVNRYPDPSSFETEESRPWVLLDPEEVLLQSLAVNLDIDVSDEQILVLKRKDEPDSPIRIAVVDFDTVLNTYKRSWQYETMANNSRTFSLSLSDVIGDHKLEIVCFGSTASGNQTLSIFWRQRSSEGPELFYTPVCEISVAGSIEIIETVRSEAYEAGMKDGESFHIVTREHAEDTRNILDIVESTYFWDFKERSFVKMQEEFIPGEKIEEAQLTRLFRGSDQEFLEFFEGPWYLSSGGDDDSIGETILFFEPDKKRMILFAGNVQEIYRWEGVTRSLKNSLFFQGSNELMPYITNEVYIRVHSMDSIFVTIRDIDSHTRIKTTNDSWSGTYTRLSESVWEQVSGGMKNPYTGTEDDVLELIGQYVADDGSRIVFNRPDFILYNTEGMVTGSYSFYTLADETFLELRFFDRSRVPVDKRLYRIHYGESVGVTEIIRTITLEPGRMSAEGFVLSGEATERFEQIETLEPDS